MKRILQLLSFLSLAGILTLCFFSWFSSDDLCYRNELSRYTVLDKAWLQYMYWDGRSLGIASLIQLTGLKYFSAPVITVIWVVSFIGMAIMILKIIQLENPVAPLQNISLIATALLSAIMWLGMWKLIPDILYWPTGGWYCVMGVLALIWIYTFQYCINNYRLSKRYVILIFITSIVCGNNSHNIILPLILISMIELLHAARFKKEIRSIIFILSAMAGLSVSAIFVLLAPGNFERLNAISWPGFHQSFFYYCLVVIAKYCYWLLALFSLLLFMLWLNKSSAFKIINEAIKNKPGIIDVMHSHRFLLAAISTVLVFSATSFFAVPRTAIFFAIFIIIYTVQKGNIHLNMFHSVRLQFGSISLLLVFLAILGYEIIKVNALKIELKNREIKYSLNVGNDVEVEAINDSNIPFAFTFVDITPDSAHWVNRCVATNFKLKTVRTTSK